jgi:hypothetical protein
MTNFITPCFGAIHRSKFSLSSSQLRTGKNGAKISTFWAIYCPKRGYRTQPRVLTLGTGNPERRALKGRQIESTNTVEVKVQF